MKHRPFLLIAFVFSAGIALEYYRIVSVAGWLAAQGILLAGYFIFRRKMNALTAALLLLNFLPLGAIYTHSYQVLKSDHIKRTEIFYRGEIIEAEGVVISDAQKRESFYGKKTTFTLALKRIKGRWDWEEKSGKVLVNIFRDADVDYGDRLRLEGKLHRPFEFSSGKRFSYKEYLSRRGVLFILSVKKIGTVEKIEGAAPRDLRAMSLKTRRHFQKIIQENFSENEAKIMTIMLLGQGPPIPAHIQDLFLNTGTVHVLAISGFNMGIVAAVIFLFLRIVPIDRRWQIVVTVLLLSFYAFLTGGRPPVVRAAIMSTVFLLSYIWERQSDALNSLGLSGFLILLVNPLNIFDVGFQLSIISVVAIIQFSPVVMEIFSRVTESFWSIDLTEHKPLQWIAQSLGVSVVAWVGVAGLIAYYFFVVTPVTVLANLLVVPLSSVVVVLGLGLLVIGTVAPFLTFAFAACIKFILALMLHILTVFAKFPGAYIYCQDVSLWQVTVYYAIVWLAFQNPYVKGKIRRSWLIDKIK